jgi:hypothetical protein
VQRLAAVQAAQLAALQAENDRLRRALGPAQGC